VERVGGRDELTVVIEVRAGSADHAGLIERYRDLLRRRLGVDVPVELVVPGALAALTGLESRQKPIRLIDNRFKA
jgi:phenylacetate-CoA ligase